MLVPKKQMAAVSVSVFLMLSLTGCSNFITLKDSTPTATATPPAVDGPAATSAPTAIPPYSSPAIATIDENAVRLQANDTLDKITAISSSSSYQKLVQETKAILPVDDEPGNAKLRAVIAGNAIAMDNIKQVFTFSDMGLLKMGAVSPDSSPQEKEFIRDVLVLNRFMAITEQLEGKSGFMDVTPGAITQKDSGLYFKSDDTPPKAIVVLKGSGPNDYHHIRGFEGLRLDGGGVRFVTEG